VEDPRFYVTLHCGWFGKGHLNNVRHSCAGKLEEMKPRARLRQHYLRPVSKVTKKKATISFVVSVCLSFCPFVHPSVRPRGTTRLPLGGFSLNLIFEYFW